MSLASSTASRIIQGRRPTGSTRRLLRFASATAPFSVTYTHRAQQLTLDDYLTRTDVIGFLILKDGRTVYERYLHGTGPTDRYLSMSVSKSIVSVLFGVAVDEGRLASLDDPVVKYLPKFRERGYREVTIRQVLQMATAIEFSEEYGDRPSGIGQLTAADRTGTPSFEDLAATLRSAGPAGRTFNYQSINTQVLAEVLFPTGYCGTSTALPTRSRGRVHPAGSRALPSRSAFRQKAAPRRCDRRRTPPEDSISFHEERPSIAFVKTPPRGVDQSELSDLNDLTGVFERVAGGFGLSSDRVRFSTKCGGWLGRHPA